MKLSAQGPIPIRLGPPGGLFRPRRGQPLVSSKRTVGNQWQAAVNLGGSIGGKGGSSQMTEGASQPEGAARTGAAKAGVGEDAQPQQLQQQQQQQELLNPLDGAERQPPAAEETEAAGEEAAAEGEG